MFATFIFTILFSNTTTQPSISFSVSTLDNNSSKVKLYCGAVEILYFLTKDYDRLPPMITILITNLQYYGYNNTIVITVLSL